jgi:hypothetical protein
MTAEDALGGEMRSLHRSRLDEMLGLDEETAERLLAGVPADDAPPDYAAATRVLNAVTAPATTRERLAELEAVSGMAATVASRPGLSTSRRSAVLTKVRSAKVVVGAAAAALSLTTGLAMAGALPGAAQGVASNMLSSLGISTPGPNSHAGTHPDSRGSSTGASNHSSDPTSGSQISGLATGTDATGVNKGVQISTAASGGQSQAGQQGGGPSFVPPNQGGTSTANQASGGASTQGTNTANQASNGASSAGSGNATGSSHRP